MPIRYACVSIDYAKVLVEKGNNEVEMESCERSRRSYPRACRCWQIVASVVHMDCTAARKGRREGTRSYGVDVHEKLHQRVLTSSKQEIAFASRRLVAVALDP